MKRYKRIAYVGKNDVSILWVSEEGTRSVQDIYEHAPPWARFVILQEDDEYQCADLKSAKMRLGTGDWWFDEVLTFQSMDAAIMAAQLKL